MPFPSQVNTVQAPAVAGDFADNNPRATVDAGEGALVAGTGGVTVGVFAWANAAMTSVLNTGSGAPTGFVSRAGQLPLITTFLADNGGVIPAGQPVTLFSHGGFFVANANAAGSTANGTGTTTVGQKIFANLTTGAIRTGAAGAAISGNLTGYVETKFYVLSVGAVGELIKASSYALG